MTSQVPPLASIFDLAEALKACALTVSLRVSSPVAENLDALHRAIRQAGVAQRGFVHARAVIETGSVDPG